MLVTWSALVVSMLALCEPNSSRSSTDPASTRPLGLQRRANLRRHRQTDRAEWGLYMELAPPVLPLDATFPGLKLEVHELAYSRSYQEPNNADRDEDDESADFAEEDGGSGEGNELPRELPTSQANAHIARRSLPSTTSSPSTLSGNHRAQAEKMSSKTHVWISLWFLLSAPVIFWDAGFCFMRPRSFRGGDLHWIWAPYSLYQDVDYVYGVEAYNRGDGFANAQSFLNLVETFMNLGYLYLQHVAQSPSAPLLGLSALVMTLSKTVLYWAQEYFCGGCGVGHNDFKTLFWLWIVPNGIWLLVPSIAIYKFVQDLTASLRVASKVTRAKKE